MKINDIISSINQFKGSAFFYTPLIFTEGKSYLFGNPEIVIEAKNKIELYKSLNSIDLYLDQGLIGYGLINYEAGYLLEEKLNSLFPENGNPILTFYLFEKNQVEIFKRNEIDYTEIKSVMETKDYSVANFKLNTDEDTYKNNIGRIRNFIKEGDTYQVNYTVKGKFDFNGNIDSLFLSLIFNQSAEYSALINNGNEKIISISPELFFEVENRIITANPMKGTIKRGLNNKQDILNKEILINSTKDRAENVMILDLLRNDLGKISEFKSVEVLSAYNIEKYESLFQMTSKVNAILKINSFAEIINNLFPCGSITGAPKIRTMEIINSLEIEPRGIYTGAIGMVRKDKYKFNVPIRTIKISGSGKGEIGVGSGVVWDSDPDEEYCETLLKSKFLTQPQNYFELFESILIEEGKPYLLEEHLHRLKEASDYFLFNYDYNKINKTIMDLLINSDNKEKYKLKITLDKWGNVKGSISEITDYNDEIKIIISENKINSNNKFQYFKTTNRYLYEEDFIKYRALGFYEVIYLNEKNELTEGSFTNVFVDSNGKWITPGIECGLLNGVFRQRLLDNCKYYSEENISLDELINADEIILVNSVRKIVKVKQLWMGDQKLKEFN